MTPKEKADDLIKKFHPYTYTAVHAHKTGGEYEDAKQCALICVDRILNTLEEELLELYDEARTCDVNKKLQEYYLEVKKEIELL